MSVQRTSTKWAKPHYFMVHRWLCSLLYLTNHSCYYYTSQSHAKWVVCVCDGVGFLRRGVTRLGNSVISGCWDRGSWIRYMGKIARSGILEHQTTAPRVLLIITLFPSCFSTKNLGPKLVWIVWFWKFLSALYAELIDVVEKISITWSFFFPPGTLYLIICVGLPGWAVVPKLSGFVFILSVPVSVSEFRCQPCHTLTTVCLCPSSRSLLHVLRRGHDLCVCIWSVSRCLWHP